MTAVGGGEPKVSATALTAGTTGVSEAVPPHEPPSSPLTTSEAAA